MVAKGVGIFIGEVSVHPSELEGDGERVRSIGDALAFVNIKEPEPFEVGPARGLNCGLDFDEHDLFFDEDGDISTGGGVAGDRVVGRNTALGLAKRIEGELGEDGGGGEAGLLGDEGVDLTKDTDFDAVEE